jgi:hypothetical protein
MAADKVQQAVALIKSGDRQNGQRLLAEVLRADPRNETAWLWMSTLVDGEKQRRCLEKVLSLNPNHPQAHELLDRLTPLVPIAQSSSAPAPEPQVWLIQTSQFRATIVYLSVEDLYVFDLLERTEGEAYQVLDEIKQGIGPREDDHSLMTEHACLAEVGEVVLHGNFLKVTTVNPSGEKKEMIAHLREENYKTEVKEQILLVLQQRLGPRFRKSTRQASRQSVWVPSLVLFLITSCAALGMSWYAGGLKAEVDGGAFVAPRIQGWVDLLLFISPNGFLIIGVILLAIIVVRMLLLLAAPPEEIVLARV